MEEQEKIEVKKVEEEVNVCYASLSKAKYHLLTAREDLKNAQLDMKMMEGKLKFMREVEIPLIQDKIKNMQCHYLVLEKNLKHILFEEVK
jgi:hypothetical protein